MAELLSGRLVTDGTGRLFIHSNPLDEAGEPTAIHLAAPDGSGTDQLITDLIEVTWSEPDGGYIAVMPGDDSHNTRHEQNVREISGTTGPLFDEDGNLVVPGDPHHSEPLPTDAHYDPTSPRFKTSAGTIPDEISSTATGHTEAYTK